MTQMTLEQAISEQILARARRHEPRITQGELAEAANISRESMNNYLRGRSAMPLPVLIAICDHLGVSLHDLVKAADAQSKQ